MDRILPTSGPRRGPPRTIRRIVKIPICLLALVIAGCAETTKFQKIDQGPAPPTSAQVLLMEPDVQLSELTAGGLEEPRADWTDIARENIAKAVAETLRTRQDTLLRYQPPKNDLEKEHLHAQLVKLHEAVGESILIHKYTPAYQLPTKTGRLDWTLGSSTSSLHEDYGADYALFVYIRDSYSSSGRVAAIVVAALLGAQLRGGLQVGFASLVDLRSGQVVWFNRLLRTTGDLRTLAPAREAVKVLLEGVPL